MKQKFKKQYFKALKRYSKFVIDEDLVSAVLDFATMFGKEEIGEIVEAMRDSGCAEAREAAGLIDKDM